MIKNKAQAVKAPRQHDDSTHVIWKASLACKRCSPTWITTLKKQFPNSTCRQAINDHGNQKWPSQRGNSFHGLNSHCACSRFIFRCRYTPVNATSAMPDESRQSSWSLHCWQRISLYVYKKCLHVICRKEMCLLISYSWRQQRLKSLSLHCYWAEIKKERGGDGAISCNVCNICSFSIITLMGEVPEKYLCHMLKRK